MMSPSPMRELHKKHLDCITTAIELGFLHRKKSGENFRANGSVFSIPVVKSLIDAGIFAVMNATRDGYPTSIVPNKDHDMIKSIHLLHREVYFNFHDIGRLAIVIGFGIRDGILHLKCDIGTNKFIPVSLVSKSTIKQPWDNE
jgi:hypothetical protein